MADEAYDRDAEVGGDSIQDAVEVREGPGDSIQQGAEDFRDVHEAAYWERQKAIDVMGDPTIATPGLLEDQDDVVRAMSDRRRDAEFDLLSDEPLPPEYEQSPRENVEEVREANAEAAREEAEEEGDELRLQALDDGTYSAVGGGEEPAPDAEQFDVEDEDVDPDSEFEEYPEDRPENLEDMTKDELKELLDDLGVEYKTSDSKADLVERVENA